MNTTKEFHLPSLDGMRAVAVMIVFVSHAGWGNIVPGGFGVTVFFFLSGFLITTLLRMEYEKTGDIGFRRFYLRRVYRILPPMYLVLFSILALWALGLVDGHVSPMALLAQVLQTTNYYVLSVPEPASLVPDTGTFWSLSVEEHFYIVFPVFFLFCLRRWRAPTIARVFLAICVLELLWRCVLILHFNVVPDRTYRATDARLDSLLFGCIMGVWMNPALDRAALFTKSALVELSVLAGALALLVFTFVFRNDAFRETIRYTLQGIALFPIFWLAVRHADWAIFRPLNWRPVRYAGMVSYVFYLSHFFWLDMATRLAPDRRVASALLAFVLTMLFSALVYRLVEQPFAALRRKLHAPERQLEKAKERQRAETA